MALDIGSLRHVVRPENPGPTVPDTEGGSTPTWIALNPPTWHCSIAPSTVRDLERAAAGSSIATASHIVTGRFHPGITTKTRLTKGARDLQGKLTPGSREFNVNGIQNLDEKNEVLVLLCEEIVK